MSIKDEMQAAQKRTADRYKKSRTKRNAEMKHITDETKSQTPNNNPEPVTGQVGRPKSNNTDKITIVTTPERKQKFKIYCLKQDKTAADVFADMVDQLPPE